jgi:hypothetical protein
MTHQQEPAKPGPSAAWVLLPQSLIDMLDDSAMQTLPAPGANVAGTESGTPGDDYAGPDGARPPMPDSTRRRPSCCRRSDCTWETFSP